MSARILPQTGYKIYDRYKDCGLDGLTDPSRRPYRHANRSSMPVEKLIAAQTVKREKRRIINSECANGCRRPDNPHI